MRKLTATQIAALCCSLIFMFNSLQLMAKQANTDLAKLAMQSESLSPAPLLPRAALLRSSSVSDVLISPNGHYLSYRKKEGHPDKQIASFWLYNIKKQHHEKLFSFKDIRHVNWSANSQSLFLKTPTGIAVSNVFTTKSPIQILNFEREEMEAWLGIDYSHPDSALVRLWDASAEAFTATRLHSNGQQTELFRSKTIFHDFGVDALGNPLYQVSNNPSDDSTGEKILYDISTDKVAPIWHCAWDDPCDIIQYDKARRRLLMVSNHRRNFSVLSLVDLQTGMLNPVHQDPQQQADSVVSHLVYSKARQFSPVITGYYGDYLRHYGLTPEIQLHIDNIQAMFSQQTVTLQLAELGNPFDSPWLITQLSPKHARHYYYLYHPKTQRFSQPLNAVTETANAAYPLINAAHIAPKFPIHFQARDGFKLQGYVTLPRGAKLANAPIVVNPHGGPWSRNDYEYDKHAQLLANRGYIVLQPNFRASTGFGKAYQQGTKKDFGNGTAQNDIVDSLQFLLRNGVGDKNKVAIVGHSFGGFSALAGLSFTPDLFQVGFAGAPPTHLGRSAKYYYRFQKKAYREINHHYMKHLVVDWEDQQAFAQSYVNSPDNHVKAINKPLVVWAGEHDRRVFIVDVKNYVSKAQQYSKQISLFVDPKALHSPNGKVGTEAYCYLMEKTLAKYLGGQFERLAPKKDKLLRRFLQKNMKVDNNQLVSNIRH